MPTVPVPCLFGRLARTTLKTPGGWSGPVIATRARGVAPMCHAPHLRHAYGRTSAWASTSWTDPTAMSAISSVGYAFFLVQARVTSAPSKSVFTR